MTKKKGFTLIELLVVIAIIGVLATLTVSSVGTARGKARNAKRKTDIKTISTAIEYYNINNGSYSVAGVCGNLGIISNNSGNICPGTVFKDSSEIYLQVIPIPPVSTQYYKYSSGSTGNPPCIYTPDLEGGEAAGTFFTCIGGSCRQATTSTCP